MVIVTREGESQDPHVLIAQRPFGDVRKTAYPGHWSASVEEQLILGEDVGTALRRTVEHELLGKGAEFPDPRVVGLMMERGPLNLTLLCFLDLAETDLYSSLLKFRPFVKHVGDTTEHRQLAAVPLQRPVIAECIRAGRLTPEVRAIPLIRHPMDDQTWTDNDEWRLHPSSAMRMAAALWIVTHPHAG